MALWFDTGDLIVNLTQCPIIYRAGLRQIAYLRPPELPRFQTAPNDATTTVVQAAGEPYVPRTQASSAAADAEWAAVKLRLTTALVPFYERGAFLIVLPACISVRQRFAAIDFQWDPTAPYQRLTYADVATATHEYAAIKTMLGL